VVIYQSALNVFTVWLSFFLFSGIIDSEVALLYVNLVAVWVKVHSSLWTVTNVECATDVDCGSMLSSHVHDQYGINPSSLFWLKGCSHIWVVSCNRWYIYTSLLASTTWWQRQSQNFTHLLCINMTAYLRRLHWLMSDVFFFKPDCPPTDCWQPLLLVLRLFYFLTIIIIIIISLFICICIYIHINIATYSMTQFISQSLIFLVFLILSKTS